MKFNVTAFAFAFGLVWGLGVFLVTWWIIAFEGSTGEVTLIGRLYRGYTISPMGSVIGMAWGLADGLIGGAIFAWLYNLMTGCICRCNPEQEASRSTVNSDSDEESRSAP